MRFLAILATALLLAAPALADPVRPFRSAWVLLDADCADLYDTPAPPGGAVDLTDITTWDTNAEAYDLQANIGAPAQTSGSPDGMCDADPASIKGSISTAATKNLYVGPIKAPAAGMYFVVDWDAIVTSWEVAVGLPTPFATSILAPLSTTAAQTTLSAYVISWGPLPLSSSSIHLSEEFAFPSDSLNLRLTLTGAGSWTVNGALVPYRSDAHGRD